MRWINGDELQELVHNTVTHHDPLNVGQVELDITLSSTIYIEKDIHPTKRVHILSYAGWRDIYDKKTASSYGHTLKPKHFILAETVEHFNMPPHISGTMTLRSWAAKSGLEQSSSLDLKPGWKGHLILELFNSLTHHELLLVPGSTIAQIKFFDIRG